MKYRDRQMADKVSGHYVKKDQCERCKTNKATRDLETVEVLPMRVCETCYREVLESRKVAR